MEINRITVKSFWARIIIGTQVGYSDELITEKNLIDFIQGYQDKLIKEKALYLSISLTGCKIILSGQAEHHFQLSFIQYPRFPLKEEVLKHEIELLTRVLMKKFSQNRIVLEFPDETIMFEVSAKIDPRIQFRERKSSSK